MNDKMLLITRLFPSMKNHRRPVRVTEFFEKRRVSLDLLIEKPTGPDCLLLLLSARLLIGFRFLSKISAARGGFSP
jgi:hypothetical protein